MPTILELRDVKYFFDGDNYYKKINNHTLQKITKEEFIILEITLFVQENRISKSNTLG